MRSLSRKNETELERKDRRRRYRKIVTCLAAVVVFATTYALVLPAMTLDDQKAEETPGIETHVEEQAAPEKSDAVSEQKAEPKKEANEDASSKSEAAQSQSEQKSEKASSSNNDSKSEKAESHKAKSDSKKADSSKDEKKVGDSKKDKDIKLIEEKTEIKYDGNGYKIIAEVGSDAKLPADTKLKVREIRKETTDENGEKYDYDAYCEDALSAVRAHDGEEAQNEKREVMLFDISFDSSAVEKAKAVGSDADEEAVKEAKAVLDKVVLDKDGNLEPAAQVKVKIVFDEAMETEDKAATRAVHFDKRLENMTEEERYQVRKDVLETKAKGDKKSVMKEAEFKSDKFSVYGFVYTTELKDQILTASGDTYEITVSYGEDAQIPEGAELRVREIADTEDEYANNVKLVNKKLKAEKKTEVVNPAQFDISIWANDKEIEPAEGSSVDVEMKLVPEVFVKEDAESEQAKASEEKADKESAKESAKDSESKKDDEGEIWFNGEKITLDESKPEEVQYTVAHVNDEGKAEVIKGVDSTVDENENIVLQFETESFSDYLFDGANGTGLWNLPNTIYVGDEIYMWNQADYWVTNIGSVVTETKHNNRDDFKTVTAISTGTFRICHRNDWNNGSTNGQGKIINVLPARTGTTPPSTIDTIDNSSIGLTLNLFDYDLDNYIDDYFNGSSHYDNAIIADFAGHGINNGNALKFWGSGIGNNYGELNKYVEHGVTRIVNNTLNSSGYPTLSNTSGGTGNRDLSYLFTPSDGTDKKAYTNVNGLFKKDGDYYVYDSNENYAYYDSSQGSGGSFKVYNRTYNQKLRDNGGEQASSVSSKPIGFFPFHKWDEEYDLFVNWNKSLNHHFGMSMSVPFSLPKAPKAVVDSDNNPIVFEFSGDDDLWVFIDGKLAMDIGGIHQPTSGTIDFTNKIVTVNGSPQNFNFGNLYDGNKHTLQVFYIERGGCDSNCKIMFNLTQYGDVEFDKVDADNRDTKLEGAVFGLYKDEECTTPLMENLNNGTSRAFVVETDSNGHAKLEDVPLGTYYLKEIHAPDGYPINISEGTQTVRVYLDESGNVKTSINNIENGAQITNKKPAPISLGLEKEWQNADGESISAPNGANATFEIKRIRSYETYTEEMIEGQGRESSHLTVGWIHNGNTHVYKEYDLIAGSTATVSWSYKDGYSGSKDCVVNGSRIDKDYVTGNVVSQALDMPAANGNATFYIVDDSDNGEAIQNINVAGSQFYGNSGGGYIHTFKTVTEPDPTFSYTGENVTENKVTLPINGSAWQYNFANLPVIGSGRVTVGGKEQKVTYNYSYYLEEVSSNVPNGTTVIYKDSNNNVISSPTDAETSTTGTQKIINNVPVGYLKINKSVTFNGVNPTTTEQKAALAGEYKFKVYTDENCSKPYKVKQGDTESDLELTITIGNDGSAQSSDVVKLPVGDYWIEEQTPTQQSVTPEENRIHVKVTADKTAENPAEADFVNNKEESDNPDELAIELEKTFTGIPDAEKIPAGFSVTLSYSVPGSVPGQSQTVEVALTGTTQGNVICTKSEDGLTWHWRVVRIPSNATNFRVKESNYDLDGYSRTTTINGESVENPGSNNSISGYQPTVTMTNMTTKSDYTTPDNDKSFVVKDNQILLVRMTNNTTVVVSQKSLGKATRDAIEKKMEENGYKIPDDNSPHAQWKANFVYFSHEIQGDSFSYGGRSIFFNGNNVEIPHKSSSHEVRVDIGYSTTTEGNSFVINNNYTENPIEVDIVKVDKTNLTKKLQGAVFTIRQIEDEAPGSNGTISTKSGTDSRNSAPTDSNGTATFNNITNGFYEVTEKSAPAGYVMTGDTTFYFKVESGQVTWLEKGTGKPSTWSPKTPNENDMVTFTAGSPAAGGQAATNATFTVKNEPGAALPSAGGPGTTWMYILGSLLTLMAGVTLVARRRMRV